VQSYKFCSYGCRGAWRQKHWTAENNPKWQAGERRKDCQHCGISFEKPRRRALSLFSEQKFCSKECSDLGGLRHFGADNGNWNGNPRTKHRESKQASWARAVISRDQATCRDCGASGIELHAHHVLPYKTHPELRWNVSNGRTLCYKCHWAAHTGTAANGVNSGEAAAGHAGGNPEPSFGRKSVEGVTTRGRAYRRWEGPCDWCQKFLSKRFSDVVGKRHIFCDRACAAKHSSVIRKGKPRKSHGSNASTSAPRESDDIVWAHVKA
jgi:hypothetical protein